LEPLKFRKFVDGIRIFKAPVRNIHHASLAVLNGIININLISIHFCLVGRDMFVENLETMSFPKFGRIAEMRPENIYVNEGKTT
jgi:hypothetical protein